DLYVTGVQTCALPISATDTRPRGACPHAPSASTRCAAGESHGLRRQAPRVRVSVAEELPRRGRSRRDRRRPAPPPLLLRQRWVQIGSAACREGGGRGG